jgi:cyanophycinase-like exopeptidase
LNLVPNACVLPHHNNFGKSWAKKLLQLLPKSTLIGIDEQTGMIDDTNGQWHVYGAGGVTLYSENKVQDHKHGTAFSLE